LTENWKRLIGLNNLKNNPFLDNESTNNLESKPELVPAEKFQRDVFAENRFQDIDFARDWENVISVKVKGKAETVFKTLDSKDFPNDPILGRPHDGKSSIFFEGNCFEIKVIHKKVFDEVDMFIIDYYISFKNFFGISPRILIRLEARTSSKETSIIIGRKLFFQETSWFSKSIEKKLRIISERLIQDLIGNLKREPQNVIKVERRSLFNIIIFLAVLFLFMMYYLKFFSLEHQLSLIREVMDRKQREFEGISKAHEKLIVKELMGKIKQIESQISFFYQ
jgi:hypothetical protein